MLQGIHSTGHTCLFSLKCAIVTGCKLLSLPGLAGLANQIGTRTTPSGDKCTNAGFHTGFWLEGGGGGGELGVPLKPRPPDLTPGR